MKAYKSLVWFFTIVLCLSSVATAAEKEGAILWRTPADDLGGVSPQPAVFWRACLVAAVNPKTLLFNAAFLPQFVGQGATTTQLTFVAGVFLTVLMLGDLLWVLFANAARPLLHKITGLRNRVTGAFLVLAGIGLGLSRRSL